MHQIQQLFYKSGWLKLSGSRIDRWAKLGKVDHLIFATQEGQFDLRLLACSHLRTFITSEKVKDALMVLVKDPVEIVGDAAMAILKTQGHGRYDQLIQEVMERRAEKKALEKRLRKRAKTSQGREDYPSLSELYNRGRDRHTPDLNGGGFGGIGFGF
ncbi:MAG: hypothetical protein R8G66_21280 [Cytophagales bacterium]|nr:hypothetical protein [Cytophagales bacterium]